MKQEASSDGLPDLNWNFQGYVDIPGLNIGPVGLLGSSSSYDSNTNISYTKVTAAHIADDWNTFTDISSPYYGDYLAGEASAVPQWTLNGGMVGIDPFSGMKTSPSNNYLEYSGISYRQSGGTVGVLQDNVDYGIWSKTVYDNNSPPSVTSIERSNRVHQRKSSAGQHTCMGLNQYIPYSTSITENFAQFNNSTGLYEKVAPTNGMLTGILKFNADDVENTAAVLRYVPERSTAFYQSNSNITTPILPVDAVPTSVAAPTVTMTLKDGTVIPGRNAVIDSFEFYLPGCVRDASDITITDGGSGITFNGASTHPDVYFMLPVPGNTLNGRLNQEEIPIVFRGTITGGVLTSINSIAIAGAGYTNSDNFIVFDWSVSYYPDIMVDLVGAGIGSSTISMVDRPTISVNISEDYAMLKGCLFNDTGLGYFINQTQWDNIINNASTTFTSTFARDVNVSYSSATDGGSTLPLLTSSAPPMGVGANAATQPLGSEGLVPCDTPNSDDMFVFRSMAFGSPDQNAAILYKNGFPIYDAKVSVGSSADPHRVQNTAKMVAYSLDDGQTALWTEYPSTATNTNNVGLAFNPTASITPVPTFAIDQVYISSAQVKNAAVISSGKKGVYYVLHELSHGTYNFNTSTGDYNHRLALSKLDFGAGPYDGSYSGTPTWSINQYMTGDRNTGTIPIGVVGASTSQVYTYGYTATDTYCSKMLIRLYQQGLSTSGYGPGELTYITFNVDQATGNITGVQIFDKTTPFGLGGTSGLKWSQVWLSYDSRNDRWVVGIDNTSGTIVDSSFPNQMIYLISDSGLPHPGYSVANWTAVTESDMGISDFWVGE